MNFLILENQEVDCGCFRSSQAEVRRIFRSKSDHSQIHKTKDINLLMVKKISDNQNCKKRSLRKQKSVYIPSSSKNTHSRQQSKDNQNSYQAAQRISKETQQNTSDFYQVIRPKFQQKIDEQYKQLYISRQKLQNIPVFLKQASINSNYNPVNIAFQSVKVNQDDQYQKLVEEEFRKDFQEFQLILNQNKEKQAQNTSQNQQKQKQKSDNVKIQDQKKQIKLFEEINENEFYTEQQINQLQKQIQRLTIQQQKKIQKKKGQKVCILPQISQQIQEQPLFPVNRPKKLTTRRQRRQSFRNSAISYKGRQLLTKKINDKLYGKQIESEKDGNSSESDNMSEVVGRGWDGLTEQRIQIEGLQEMMYNEKKNGQTETMITQESHIKNSNSKTFTEYTNSFISPKTHRPTSTLFGSPLLKYGIIGMSYQHIDDLTKPNNSFLQKNRL